MAVIKTHARVKTFPQFPLFFNVTANQWRVAQLDPDAKEVAPWNTQGAEFGMLFFSNPGVDGPEDGDPSTGGSDYQLADVRKLQGSLITAERMQPTIGLWETNDPIYMAVTSTQECIVHAELLQYTNRIVPSGAGASAANQAAPISAAGFVRRVTDNAESVSGNFTTKSITVPSNKHKISAAAIGVSAIVGLTHLDWYLSWDADGKEFITDVQNWEIDVDLIEGKTDGFYGAVGKVELDLSRFTDIGVPLTLYFHHKGTGGTAAVAVTLHGTE